MKIALLKGEYNERSCVLLGDINEQFESQESFLTAALVLLAVFGLGAAIQFQNLNNGTDPIVDTSQKMVRPILCMLHGGTMI